MRGFVGRPSDGRTLEPQLLSSAGETLINEIIERTFPTRSELLNYLTESKTDFALRVFNYPTEVPMPPYVNEAIDFIEWRSRGGRWIREDGIFGR